MRKIILYIATSLNGKIARENGSVDWLETIENPDKSDYGYSDFLDSVDTTIQGFNTYKQVQDWGIEFPYKDKKNFVLSRKQKTEKDEFVEFISSENLELIRDIKNSTGKDIWLIGGSQINTVFLNENLIDEIRLFVMPIIIPDGIELFSLKPVEKQIQLIETKSFSSGVIELRYKIK